MSAADEVRAARDRAAWFQLSERGLIEVRGADRVRFLQGQLSADVGSLDATGPRSGCYALALTPQGRIVVDLHVLARSESIWLETAAACVPAALARLGKYVIADDVELVDRSGEIARFGIEGPRAPELLAGAAGTRLALAPEAGAEIRIAGSVGLAAAFGWSGEAAFQLFFPRAAQAGVAAALRHAAAACGASEAGGEALEVLRVEAGIPRAGAELGEDVLPAEARLLERAVSFTKGCYTGQEVVARMASRGRVGHLLVGLVFEGALPAPGAALHAGDVRAGAVTSAALSPHAGPIGLAFVRRGHDEPGTRLAVDGGGARVAALPFVRPHDGPAGSAHDPAGSAGSGA
jgi:folate-binding protein YgfZ